MVEIKSVGEFQSLLEQKGYFVEKALARRVLAALHTRPVAGAFLFGMAGSGKTYLPEVLSKVWHLTPGKQYFFYQCFPGTREEDLLVKILPSEETISGVRLHEGVVLQAAKATHEHERVMLVLDEWDKTRPSADSFMLDFLQYGRIQFNGISVEADLSRLIVFITSNDEREISEPLLRRLPKIDFSPLHPSLVEKALSLTHPEHSYLPAVLQLYRFCLRAGLPKPATVQELRQLLDAIEVLGAEADWDELVYQFVTKTPENHALLKRAEEGFYIDEEEEKPESIRLDPDAYVPAELVEPADEPEERQPSMPRLAEIHPRFVKEVEGIDEEKVDPEAIAGVLERNDASYDALVDMEPEPPESADFSDTDTARVYEDKILLLKPLELYSALDSKVWGNEGEVLIVEPLAGIEHVKELRSSFDFRVFKWSRSEILARQDTTPAVYARWTPERGLEMIVPTTKRGLVREIIENPLFYQDGRPPSWNSWEKREPLVPGTPKFLKSLIKRPEKWGYLWYKKYAEQLEKLAEEENTDEES